MAPPAALLLALRGWWARLAGCGAFRLLAGLQAAGKRGPLACEVKISEAMGWAFFRAVERDLRQRAVMADLVGKAEVVVAHGGLLDPACLY